MSERYRAGIDTLFGLSADNGDLVSDALAATAPEFVRLTVEFAFGDIFARTGLDPRTRLFVAIGALAAIGRSPGRLRWFVRAALETGVNRDEVIEAIMQVTVFAGFVTAADALEACADLLEGHADESDGACPVAVGAR